MEKWSELIRSGVRPFIVVWGLLFYSWCIIRGIEMPSLLSILVYALIIEYFGERAIKRWNNKT